VPAATNNETAPLLSVAVPCHNEEGNLRPLVSALQETLEPLGWSYEIVITDDVSTDNSWPVLKELSAADRRVRAQRLARNSGQSAAIWAAIKAARGRYIATMDADLQNDPRQLPNFLEKLKEYDCVCGSRVASRAKGDSKVRQLSSRFANWVRNKLTRETVSDSACGYRVFKRECASNLKFFKGMHRFMPTLFKIEGYTVTEIPVEHKPRHAGLAHYGVGNRVFAATYDLLAVRWMQKRMFRFEVAEQAGFAASAESKPLAGTPK
jgi:dolichol-phosphate mannosyltransferase